MLLSFVQEKVFVASVRGATAGIISLLSHCGHSLLGLISFLIFVTSHSVLAVLHRTALNAALWSVQLSLLREDIIIMLVGLEHILVLLRCDIILGLILVHNLDAFVLTRLVNIQDVFLSLLHNDLSDVFHVSFFGAFLNFNRNFGVLDKDLIIQELFGDRNSFDIFLGKVEELRFLIKADVVIANV